jgi:prolyl-tRNA synthetase
MSKEKGISVKKNNNFSEWYSQVIEKSEIVDIRNNLKGFIVIRPWGALTIENMFDLYEKEMQKLGHNPVIFPTVIAERNFKKEEHHVEGFSPEVFWLEEKKGEERLALRPTSETAMYEMYSLWIRSHRDLPLKIYQRANIFRFDTKATRPLIRGREFYWIEAHNCFASLEEAEKQVEEDIATTEKIMHQKFGIPFLALKRPEWDKFPGAEYTVGSDVLMPDGKVIQQPSTHLLGQHFSKAFGITFKDDDGKEKYVYQTCYGPAISRILVSVISMHGDDSGLVMPYCIAPLQVIIVPIYKENNKNKILKESEKLLDNLRKQGIKAEIDDSEKRPGEKFNEWELRGVPFRIEIGEKELKEKKVTLFTRDTMKKEKIGLNNISKIQKKGIEFDERLRKNADKSIKGKIIDCENKKEVIKAVDNGKIARVNFCSLGKDGVKCAEIVEKDINAEVRGERRDIKEKAKGKCVICNKKAEVVTYIARSY